MTQIHQALTDQLPGYDIVELYNKDGQPESPSLQERVREFLTARPKRPRIVFCSLAILRGYEVTNFVKILLGNDIASDEFISRFVNCTF